MTNTTDGKASETKRYRINYGNGQVSNTQTLFECKRELAAMTEYKKFAYIQINRGGEWFTYGRID